MFFVDASCRTGFEFVMVFADLVMPAFFCSCSLVVGWRRVTATGKNLVSQLQERILRHSSTGKNLVSHSQSQNSAHSPARGLYELQEQIWARRASHPQRSGGYCDDGRELNLIACLFNFQKCID